MTTEGIGAAVGAAAGRGAVVGLGGDSNRPSRSIFQLESGTEAVRAARLGRVAVAASVALATSAASRSRLLTPRLQGSCRTGLLTGDLGLEEHPDAMTKM